jgi:hypothetical protein
LPTAIEQFDLQDADAIVWGYDTGWQEAEYAPTTGVWRWTSDRATLRILGPPSNVRVTFSIESPLRYFATGSRVRISAGDRELAVATMADSKDVTVDVPSAVLASSHGLVTIETDQTFVPAERGGPPDRRRLGLRIFGVRVSNALTPREPTR